MKQPRNIYWKNLNVRQRLDFILLCAAGVWILVLALFGPVMNLPDWLVLLLFAPVAYPVWRVTMGPERFYVEDDEPSDEEEDDPEEEN